MAHPWRPQLRLVAAVAVGGAAGALLRYAAETIWPTPAGAWPTAVFLVNLTGCLVLGLLGGRLATREVGGRATPDWLRPLAVTGVLGGLTTFSTMMVDAIELAEARGMLPAIAYLGASCALGLVLVSLGWFVSSPGSFRAAGDELTEAEQA